MISNTFKVGAITCEMTVSALGHISAAWSLQLPVRLSRKERAQYRAGRDALIAEFAKATGIDVMIVEV